jgi:hypothetical protein
MKSPLKRKQVQPTVDAVLTPIEQRVLELETLFHKQDGASPLLTECSAINKLLIHKVNSSEGGAFALVPATVGMQLDTKRMNKLAGIERNGALAILMAPLNETEELSQYGPDSWKFKSFLKSIDKMLGLKRKSRGGYNG